jgi:hypothetical protein
MMGAGASEGRITSDAPRPTLDALRWTVALACGAMPEDAGPRDWGAVRHVARLERCLGVAWLRSGSFIRRTAPAAVVARWRAELAALDDASRRQLEVLARVVRGFESVGLTPVVLKGAPLSQRLYGDPFARHSADLDLFVRAHERADAHAWLLANGWRHDGGAAPAEAIYRAEGQPVRTVLELHSTLDDDDLLSTLRLPAPAAAPIDVDGVKFPAHDGSSLPVYLAAHLAKHTSAPILWLVDFATLWRALPDEQRAAAWQEARECGGVRYLRWAVERAEALRLAASGSRSALRRCGGISGLVPERHGVMRNALLAERPIDGGRLIAGWVARRMLNLGRSPREQLGRLAWLERLAARARGLPLAPVASSGAVTSSVVSARVLTIDAASSLGLVREGVAGGASAWLVARGTSMWPAIHSGARVRIAPLGARAPRPGEIVLVDAGHGDPLMHRVIGVRGSMVILRGDNMPRADHPLPIAAVIGIATHVDHGAGARELVTGRLRPRLEHWWHRARRGIRNRLEHAGGAA